MATANEAWRDALTRHQIYVLRYGGGLRNRVNTLLADTESTLAERIRGKLASHTGLTSVADTRRLESINKTVRTIRTEAWGKADALIREDLAALAIAESAGTATTLAAVSPVILDVAVPAPALLRSIVTSRPFQGRVMREWAAKMADDDIRAIQNQIRVGMTSGDTAAQIVQRVIGTARANGSDGITQMSRNQVHTVVRTAVMHVTGEARREFVQANSDILSKELYVATLDHATCLQCAPLDGQEFDIGKGPQPPLHYQCRCLRIPAISQEFGAERPNKPVTERMLVREYAKENGLGDISNRDALPRGTKGAFDKFARQRTRELVGPIPASIKYPEWLRSQSAEFQDDVLGKAKGKLFRNGGLPLMQFTNRNGDELNLVELQQRHKAAFEAAGL